jgi:endo-1,4-beta-xylanase
MKRSNDNSIFKCFIRCITATLLILIYYFQANLCAAPIAEGCDKFLGNISTAGPPSNYGNYWNQVTLENDGKWANVEPNRGQFNWNSVTAAYNYCKTNKIPYKHHTFVWGEQYPGWMNNLSAADQKAEVEKLIKTFGEKFPETAYIDVVNEARQKSPSWKTALGGAGETGYDWIVWSFQMARKYCPNAKLFINEYYCEYSLEFVTEYLKIIKVLKGKNLIDGIGIQSHDGETKKGFQMGTLKQCLDSLATSGVPLYSTEFDMSGTDAEQLKFYQDIFPIIWEHPAMRGVTLWGWTDSWLLHMSTPKDGRLMINGTERPALKWLRTYVAEHKNTIPITPVYRVVSPSTQKMPMEYIDGRLRFNIDNTQSIVIRALDPTGRIVYSLPQQLYSPGMHDVVLPLQRTASGYRLLTLQGAGSVVTQEVMIQR